METVFFDELGLSLMLGLLVGLQRDHAGGSPGGMRTFALVTLLGTVAALLTPFVGGWVLGAGMLGVLAMIVCSHAYPIEILGEDYSKDSEKGQRRVPRGLTTDAAMLLMYFVGALILLPESMLVKNMPAGPQISGKVLAIVIAGTVAILLQFKGTFHKITTKLDDGDIRAIMQFVLISCIILPVLPNRDMGPFNAFNPFETWLLVVLIVGMSLGGYIAYRFLGQSAGILLGGFLGGAISSTATTASYGRLSRLGSDAMRATLIVIMIASSVMYGRILIEMAVISKEFFWNSVWQMLILAGLTFLPALYLWIRSRDVAMEMPEQQNPTQLKSALLFAVMYAAVLIALAAVRHYEVIGQGGMYVVAAISGMTDMDAITLSTGQLAGRDAEVMANGWRLVVVGALANLVFKAGIAASLGGRALLARLTPLFAIPMVGGILLILLW